MQAAKKISLALIASTLAFGALGSSSPASAGGLSKQEAALLAGAGGFVLGAIIGSHSHHAGHHRRVVYVNSWEAHVNRCHARYNTYDERSDTYISYAGYEKRCRL